MDIKEWNKNLKYLKEIIFKEEKFEESRNIMLMLHAMVHSSDISEINLKTFEDELWENFDERVFRNNVQKKGRTVLYGMWHSSRIEDITMNILVAGEKQIISQNNFYEKINSGITDTGNSLSENEIMELSRSININYLREYRDKVGLKTEEIIKNFNYKDLKKKILPERLEKVLEEKAVLETENSVWLIDFWERKNVAGIVLMPALRHNLVHINESLEAKKRS
ncbi:MAG: DinB family protein [Thermotogae bacterium]|nr:DinB family protein [Thermotogota bacterium]